MLVLISYLYLESSSTTSAGTDTGIEGSRFQLFVPLIHARGIILIVPCYTHARHNKLLVVEDVKWYHMSRLRKMM